jgi:hypothetical protein
MSTLASSSTLSYTASSKREELFDETGRFLLLTRTDGSNTTDLDTGSGVDMPGGMPVSRQEYRKGKGKAEHVNGGSTGMVEGGDEGVLGYVSFRFDTEETLGPKDAEVIYW